MLLEELRWYVRIAELRARDRLGEEADMTRAYRNSFTRTVRRWRGHIHVTELEYPHWRRRPAILLRSAVFRARHLRDLSFLLSRPNLRVATLRTAVSKYYSEGEGRTVVVVRVTSRDDQDFSREWDMPVTDRLRLLSLRRPTEEEIWAYGRLQLPLNFFKSGASSSAAS